MRTRNIFRYLLAIIIALGTTANAMAQQRALKIYFNENGDTATGPRILVKDDNGNYELPKGLKVTLGGAVWADKARFWEMFQQDVSDRVIAAYTASDKKESKLTLNFTNFPYEVNMIQWNVMNDLLSASILNLLDNYRVTTKCIQSNNGGWSYTDEHWDMNFLVKNTTFTQKNVPWRENAVLNGLKSFEIGEQCWKKSPLGILINRQVELDDKCRTFIKAGWNGSNTNSNITDNDDSNWAFKVKFTLPDINIRCYNATTNKVDNSIIVKEADGTHKLQGYISAHPGAVEVTTNPSDPDRFHYEYTVLSGNKIAIGQYDGIITDVKESGTVQVEVKLMRGTREVTSKIATINVSAVDPNAPKIAIAFADGNKGYDITVGDDNAQIQGIITQKAKDSNGNEYDIIPQEGYQADGYYFQYSADNDNIITIDKYTGKITAKEEGDVNVSAVLKKGSDVISDTYTYTLHVFAQHEGLEWKRIDTYQYSDNSSYNYSGWVVTAVNSQSYEWKSENLLKTNTSINPSGEDWKQIASFKTTSASYWRAICQKLQFDIKVPKYSKATATYSLAGNVAIGDKKTHRYWDIYHYVTTDGNCKYGFEVKDLDKGTLSDADTKIKNITWNTNNQSSESTPTSYTTKLRKYTEDYTSNIGDNGSIQRTVDNSKGSDNTTGSRYLAIMAYLWNDESYPGDVSFGFKGIPTYTYYATVTYYKNDGTGDVWGDPEEFTSTSKTGTKKMLQNKNLPTRPGYTFVGWSTNPDPNTATKEYEGKGDFCPYDNVNGGGKGPVSLYAVWKVNSYTVKLDHNYNSVQDQIVAYYSQPMPEGEDIVAPARKGYDFNGYRTHNNDANPRVFYYDANMKSVHNYDKTTGYTFYADWIAHTTTITFDPQGGNNYGATQVTATYGEVMPTNGVQAPQKEGYTFGGYYSMQNGAGTQYYTASMTSTTKWYVDTVRYTLYAKWIPLTYTVTLDPQGGTGGTTSVTAAYGQPLPNGLTAPTKEGYEFKGYYSSLNQEWAESIGQDYDGKQYYDKDMVGVADWDYTYSGVTLYAHWAPATFIVTFDGTNGAIVPKQMQYDNGNLPFSDVIYNSEGVVKISFTYGSQCPSQITNGKFKKAGFKLVGFYDSNNVLVATVDLDHPEDRNIYFNESSGYWTKKNGNFVWNCAHDVNLTARYEPKYTVRDGDIIDFGTEYLEVGIDWENSMVHDLLGAAEAEKEAGRISSTNPVMVFDIRNARYLDGSSKNSSNLMVPLRDKDFISPNLLVYLGEGAYNVIENEIETDGKCPGLVVTDRFPIKIPYAFNASKASYARDAKVASTDAGLEQAKNSYWGTLCLPYPIRNNASGVKFYEFQSTANNYFMFEEMSDNEVIPANTPVLYCRTDGGVGSMITIEEEEKDVNCNGIITKDEMVSVPANPNFTALVKSYANAHESIQDWEFRGNLKTNVFCGRGYINAPAEAIANSDITNNGEVYYFKQNKFTRLVPAMTKNGTRYEAGKMTLYPYRAYFYKKGVNGSSAKVSAYSILVVGEDGNTTDITDAIFGDGEGDGKIYDLNGIRVMQPVKGRLYIVNGQKKVYR